MQTSLTRLALAAFVVASFIAAPMFAPRIASAQEAGAADTTVTEDDIIAGTMDIDFKTRTNLDTSGDFKEGSPALGVQDLYKFSLRVAKTTEFSGQITRQPNLYTKMLQRSKQSAALGFNIDLGLLNPKDMKQKKTVGKWVGMVPIDAKSGAFDLAGGRADERPLRIAVDAVGRASAFTDHFGGKLVGKAEKKDNLASYTYKRLVGGKEVAITVKKSDPMKFENIELAKGPAEVYPHTYVNGRLDYDYETGNWYTDGIRFRYNLNGQDFEDIVTGTIKWVEDPDRKTNGKGHYDFNLRFNEEKNKSAAGEAAAFEKMSDEEAFFAVDTTVPALTGRIAYTDTMAGGSDLPSSSKVEYHLNANKLTKQQVMNFFKLWMVCVGPTNDE
ncbi:MAG: hypothetical protein ACREIT_10485 [Tepidisphaeraceae bacterium]